MILTLEDNKYHYFCIKLAYDPLQSKNLLKLNDPANTDVLLQLEGDIEIFFNRIQATDESYIVKFDDFILIIFKTFTRRRSGVIKNIFLKNVKLFNDSEFNSFTKVRQKVYALKNGTFPHFQEISPLKKTQFYGLLQDYQDKTGLILQSNISQYDGEDIAVFKNRDNWHTWQKDLFNYLFDENEDFRPPSHREILFIFDPFGNTGKSSFVKWLRITYEQEIGIITEANAQQLRSSLITIGKKSLYIVDLPRTKSKQGVNDVLNILEQVKSGMLQSVMYGRHKEMIFEPVHIVVFGNYVPVGGLSTDRFKTWRLERKTGSEDVIKEDISKESQLKAKKEIQTNQLAEELNTFKKDDQLSKLMDKYQDFEQMNIEEIDKFLKKLASIRSKKVKAKKDDLSGSYSKT